jgi:hypothetical protein
MYITQHSDIVRQAHQIQSTEQIQPTVHRHRQVKPKSIMYIIQSILQKRLPTRISKCNVFNLASYRIPPELLQVLSLSLKFIPEPKEISDNSLLKSFNEFSRRIRFMYQYISKNQIPRPSSY